MLHWRSNPEPSICYAQAILWATELDHQALQSSCSKWLYSFPLLLWMRVLPLPHPYRTSYSVTDGNHPGCMQWYCIVVWICDVEGFVLFLHVPHSYFPIIFIQVSLQIFSHFKWCSLHFGDRALIWCTIGKYLSQLMAGHYIFLLTKIFELQIFKIPQSPVYP